mmetsp:Transcript_4114/g.11005  ORF Transcript_4114/g.11005 Transcript_4114/m.11005 type:complete len:155 (-) Transcript_4114:2105-2569(-)
MVSLEPEHWHAVTQHKPKMEPRLAALSTPSEAAAPPVREGSLSLSLEDFLSTAEGVAELFPVDDDCEDRGTFFVQPTVEEPPAPGVPALRALLGLPLGLRWLVQAVLAAGALGEPLPKPALSCKPADKDSIAPTKPPVFVFVGPSETPCTTSAA